jgi:hypothetical protein
MYDIFVKENLEWMKSGKVGCTFASYFARVPLSIGWFFDTAPTELIIPENCLMLSLVFPHCNKKIVREWALKNGFYIEQITETLEGLRYKCNEGVSWVQYFGFDADVDTRKCPHPMLTFCTKLPTKYYFKVGFKGILHIAHACVSGITDYVANTMWDSSHRNTKKQLGYKPTIKQAAKTTYHV